MSLQTQNLVMVGLGIENDAPPNEWQPQLVDGIHLRWAFRPECGFPWHGYYLFRREHVTSTALDLVRSVSFMLSAGPIPKDRLTTAHGVIKADGKVALTDDFVHGSGDPRLGIELPKGGLGFAFKQPASTSRGVSVRITFREKGSIRIVAYAFGKPIVEEILKGEANQSRRADLYADAITAVSIVPVGTQPVSAVIVRLEFVPVSTDAGVGWKLLHRGPIALPLTHPSYPCAPAAENLTNARNQARQRIRYGKPEPFTDRCAAMHTAGAISVRSGSQIVSGEGDTRWHDGLVGGVFEVRGDRTVYTVLAVMNDRKLLISRPYAGPSRTRVPYAIYGSDTEEDPFGQLYDQLVQLVAGGPGAGAMHERCTRQVQRVYDRGHLRRLSPDSYEVEGAGTDWSADLAGFGLQIIGARAGTVSVVHGSRTATQDPGAPIWMVAIIGMRFRAAGDEESYVVTDVHLSDVEPCTLTLDRPYQGASGKRKVFEIVDTAIYPIARIDDRTHLTLEEPYQGHGWAEVDYAIVASPQTSGSVQGDPHLMRQSPLEMVTLASLHPAVAQELGLYWIDEDAVSGVAYDYLIVADRTAHVGLGPNTQSGDLPRILSLDGVDAYIVFNKKRAPASRLTEPANPRVYALPTFIGEPGARNSAGLTWEAPDANGLSSDGKAVMYLLWRAYLGDAGPTAAPRDRDYKLISQDVKGRIKPVLVPRPLPSANGDKPEPQRPGDWPPFQLSVIDRGGGNGRPPGLADGWYSYRVAGMDLFGRHTPWSEPAQWCQWAPTPEPKPWYYVDPAGNKVINRFAVRLIDKTPPPPPTGVEVYALDPADPFVTRDAAYEAWRRSVSVSTVGLRIRWQWTDAQQQQAPDTREFRVYYQPGLVNARVGKILGEIESHGTTISVVQTDISNSDPLTQYLGAYLRAGAELFKVNHSFADDPLRLGVDNVGVRHDIRPPANVPCTLIMPPDHSKGTLNVTRGSTEITGNGTQWDSDFKGRKLKVIGEAGEYEITSVSSKTRLELRQAYQGSSGAGKRYCIRHPYTVDYRDPASWLQRMLVVGYDEHVLVTIPAVRDDANGEELRGRSATPEARNPAEIRLNHRVNLPADSLNQVRLWLQTDTNRREKRYGILGIRPGTDEDGKETSILTLSEAPRLAGGASPWVIGPPAELRQYEVFLPAPETGPAWLFEPTLADPIVYARIGVSAADDKAHAPDKRGDRPMDGVWGGRYGNEGRVGAIATAFRVKRTLPEAPVPPPDSERVEATPADYHGNSYYTFRWQPMAYLKTHVFRALDDSLIKRDWLIRTTRTALDPNLARHRTCFPEKDSDGTSWDLSRKQAAASELNNITSLDSYGSLSGDAKTVLARLPGNENLFWNGGLQERDWEIRRSRRALSADNTGYFPSEWSNPKREAVAAELNAIRSLDAYKTLSNDALRVLAGLPGNERAFTQITTKPLDPNDPACANRAGPDNPPEFPIDTDLRIYTDTLPGRSTNRYFYRAAYLDGAQNRSLLSLSSPPVYLPNVAPPKAPVITKVEGGDRQITISWAHNREPNLADYWVYRTESKEAARDLRLMTRIVPPGEAPVEHSGQMSWTDSDLPGMVTFYYRVVAVDDAGNVSRPSQLVSGRAHDQRPPEPPSWVTAEWMADMGGIQLSWFSSEPNMQTIVLRRDNTGWRPISRWLESGTMSFTDRNAVRSLDNRYRLRVRNTRGSTNIAYAEIMVPSPVE